jgi:hypothetical protein
MNPIYKFNNGRGAMLCNECRVIISTGPKTNEFYCDKCKQKNHIIEIMKSDEELGLYDDEKINKDMESKKVFIVYDEESYYGITRIHKVFYNEEDAINYVKHLKNTTGWNLTDYEECEIQ